MGLVLAKLLKMKAEGPRAWGGAEPMWEVGGLGLGTGGYRAWNQADQGRKTQGKHLSKEDGLLVLGGLRASG